jgi:hypothetical protein
MFGERGDDPPARLVAVEAVERRARIHEGRVVGEDRERGQTMAVARGVVVLVVARGYPSRGPCRRRVNDVRDDRHVAVHERVRTVRSTGAR